MTQMLIVAAVVATGLACDTPTRFDRLVDLSQREGAVSEPDSLLLRAPGTPASREGGASILPTATIDHDTRYVLAAHPHHVIADREGIEMTKPDIAVFKKSVTGFFPDAKNLLINVRLFVLGEKDWQVRPPILRPLDELGDELTLDLEIHGEPEGTIVHLWVDAYQAPPIGGTRYLASPRLIPDGSRMEFAFGIMEAAILQGPVRFTVSACDRAVCESLFTEVLDPEEKGRLVWQDRSISLSPVWGETRALKFEAMPERKEAMSLPVWANPRVVSEGVSPERPNVILLSIDTLRRDHLSVYGYERDTSPFIKDHLAAKGAVFGNVVSEAATTEVSHMTMFSSLPGMVHGITSYENRLAVPIVTLAEAFREQGFDTAAFTEAGPLNPKLGFQLGFDRWKENPSIHFFFPVGQVERVFGQAWDWISRRRSRPFFLFLHTFQVHHPLSPPMEYREYFLDDEVELSEASKQLAQYDREIRFVDDQLGMLWTKLENSGLTQNTVLVVTSDHGDEFWEHGERGHASLPYEELLSVPLILFGPTVAPGVLSQEPLHHLDLMPTILDLVGIPIPEHVLGKSFAHLVRRMEPEVEMVAASEIRTSASWIAPKGISVPVFAIRNQNLKVIRYLEGSETRLKCFTLESDPGEKMDLCADGPTDEASKLLLRLEAYESEMQERHLGLANESLAQGESQEISLSPEHEAQLRALGYVK